MDDRKVHGCIVSQGVQPWSIPISREKTGEIWATRPYEGTRGRCLWDEFVMALRLGFASAGAEAQLSGSLTARHKHVRYEAETQRPGELCG